MAGRFGRVYTSTWPHDGLVDEYKDTYSYTMFGVMGEIHLDNTFESLEITSLALGDQFDLYIGVSMGLFISSWKSKDVYYSYKWNPNTNDWYWQKNENKYSGSSTNPFLRSYLGGRYMFSPKLGGFAALGYSYFGYLNLGVTSKM